MRPSSRLVVAALAALAASASPARAEEEGDPITCFQDTCMVHQPITDKVKKAFEAVPDKESKLVSIEAALTTADLKALVTKLPWVKRLRLACDDCKLSDLKPLASLKGLKELWLMRMFEVRDLSPVLGLTELEVLDVNVCQVGDLAPFTALQKLRRLHVDQVRAKDLSPLTKLPALEELWLRGGKDVADWAPLAGLTQLRSLDVSTLFDLRVVAKLTRLERLRVAFGDAISDLSPLAGLKQLRRLELERTAVTDVTPLAGLGELTLLSLQLAEKLADIRPLAKLGKLEEVRLGGTRVTDLGPLRGRAAALKSLQVPKGIPDAQVAPFKANSKLHLFVY